MKLSAEIGTKVALNSVKISLSYNNNAVDNDFTNARVYVDPTGNGNYNGSDIQLGVAFITPNNGMIKFTNISGLTINPMKTTNILITIGHKAMVSGMSVQGIVKTNYLGIIDTVNGVTNGSLGKATGIVKEVPASLSIISTVNSGNVTQPYLLQQSEYNKELIGFRASASIAENIAIKQFKSFVSIWRRN